MGSRTSKIDFSDFILDDFAPKITIPTSIRVRNLTFDQFLKIFGKFEKKKKIENCVKKHFFKIAKKSF